jgi:fructose-bisphosphate aldolase, class I
MNVGKRVRLNRLFAHSSGRMFAVAVDHFIGYNLDVLPPGLRGMDKTLAQVVAGCPDAVTMHKGIAEKCWPRYAGKVAFILQSTLGRLDHTAMEQIADAEDAVRLGADALACAAFIRGEGEAKQLKMVADNVKDAARYDMPVIVHIYPRVFEGGVAVSFEPEHIAWAVHCAYECGVDVVKVPYCNDVAAYRQIVDECPVPVVAAGGPKARTFEDALSMLADVVESGAKGATVGRNVWGFPKVTEAVRAIGAVIHDGKSAKEAMGMAGLA